MLRETSLVRSTACVTVLAISCVAAPCSSTAVAITVEIALTSEIVEQIVRIASTASMVFLH
jgi:hypothetical protein